MRYFLRGPFTIAGTITLGGGVLLLALGAFVLVIEARPLWAWLLTCVVLAPMIGGGLLLLREGLKEMTVDDRGLAMRKPWGRERRIDFAQMRVVGADESWFARLSLILADARSDSGTETRMSIPRNLSVYPQILNELRERAPEVWAAAAPALPVVADRRFEYVALMALGNLTLLPILGLLWWNTNLATATVENLVLGAIVTLFIGGGLGGSTYYMLQAISYVQFRRDGVLARSMLGVYLDLPAAGFTRIEVRRQERSVKGMRFFEDDLYLVEGEDQGEPGEHKFPLRLVQTSRSSPRELASRLGEAWDLPVHETENRMHAAKQAHVDSGKSDN